MVTMSEPGEMIFFFLSTSDDFCGNTDETDGQAKFLIFIEFVL